MTASYYSSFEIVVAGTDPRFAVISDSHGRLIARRTALFRNSCNVFRASACAFTTTERALRGTFHQFREVCGFSALTCCADKKTRSAAGCKMPLTSGIKRPSLRRIYHRFGKNQQHYRVTLFNCRSAHASSMSNRITNVS